MNSAQAEELTVQKPLRLWPGVLAAALLVAIRFVLPKVMPDALIFAVLGGLVAGLVVILWWAFFSRAPRWDRWGAVALMIVAMAATPKLVLDKSIATGMMNMMYYVYALPVLGVIFVAWAVATQRLSLGIRRATMVAAIVLACAGWGLLRTNGITGDAGSDFAWRWTPTAEDRLLVSAAKETPALAAAPDPLLVTPVKLPEAPAATPAAAVPTSLPTPEAKIPEPVVVPEPAGPSWSGFRGPNRDSIIPGLRIETDWAKTPPVELWRRPIGPGWSSFAVRGGLIYTQEQRGESEVVTCYNAATGKPVWTHKDAVRFWESNGGAGPRATPTLSNGRVYTFGATGILNALDARTGAVVWSRNAAADTSMKVPGWGFSASPVVFKGMVIIAASGKLAAFDVATGAPRWSGPKSGGGYSSPHLVTLAGVPQVLLMSSAGTMSVDPANGKVLWESKMPGDTSIVQPAVSPEGDILMTTSDASGPAGIRRIGVTHGAGGWIVEERWTSTGLKPYFNDSVIHNGAVYGFDGSILACIDLKDGKRKWKGGRYGHGQMVVLADQDVLLVLSEEGDVALVSATQDGFKELAKFKALEGKTWNHPVVAGDELLVRNGEEMAAFRLAPSHAQ